MIVSSGFKVLKVAKVLKVFNDLVENRLLSFNFLNFFNFFPQIQLITTERCATTAPMAKPPTTSLRLW